MTEILNILIAEDEAHIATALKAILAKGLRGSIVTVTRDGQAALDALHKKKFDLVISDWNMPRMTGVELLAEVRANEKLKNTPFLMLTARGDKDSVITAMKSGVTQYIAKPFENQIIIDKARALLEGGHGKTLGSALSEKQKTVPDNDEDVINFLINRLKKGFIEFPVMPEVGMRAAELSQNENVSIDELSSLILQDSALTSRLLSIANSPFYTSSREFESIDDAIVRIGLRDVSNLIVAISNKNMFEKASGIFEKKLVELWEHSFATASCAKIISKKIGIKNSDRMFSMGLLHDIGKLVLLTVLFQLSKKREVTESDLNEILGQLHVTFGKAVIERWQMPTDFIDVIVGHHDLENIATHPAETQIVAFANLLVRKLGYSLIDDDNSDLATHELAGILSLDAETIEKILEQTEFYVDGMKNAV